MVDQHKFSGTDGMLKKIRLLARRCATATQGLPRTLLVAVTAPDPVTTPDCQHAGLRGVRIQTLDERMTAAEAATLMGTLYGFLDALEDAYTLEYGEEFRESVDVARGTHGHAMGMSVVPVEPTRSKPWKPRMQLRKS